MREVREFKASQVLFSLVLLCIGISLFEFSRVIRASLLLALDREPMGEDPIDRLELLLTLCKRNPHPESVPINRLIQIPGTPLEDQPKISIWEMIRAIAVARIVLPKSMVRLSAGRIEMSYEQQALCFLAGANSIFAGEKLCRLGDFYI